VPVLRPPGVGIQALREGTLATPKEA
jgi:hypothetical protein